MLDFGGFGVRNRLVLTPANSVIFFKSLPATEEDGGYRPTDTVAPVTP